MFRFIKRRSEKIGVPPGTLVHIGEKLTDKVKITIMDYDNEQFQEKEVKTIEECFPFKGRPTVTWINIEGLHQVEVIGKLGKYFEIHPLLLEDILNTDQRPKMEDLGDYIFIVLKLIDYDEITDEILLQQMSLIAGPDFVISFQEREGTEFNSLRERIRNNQGRIRKRGPDYLAYCLLDTTVDIYFTILEKVGDKLEAIETQLIQSPDLQVLQDIHKLKREMLFLRKAVWPLRTVVNNLERKESKLIQETTVKYIRDVYDHTIQVIDTIETYRDMLSGMLDLYLSSVSNKMNEIMKVLTIIATIFIPLTFIAGIYGMNFSNMPELRWAWGYYVIWFIIIGIGALMMTYFRRKGWL